MRKIILITILIASIIITGCSMDNGDVISEEITPTPIQATPTPLPPLENQYPLPTAVIENSLDAEPLPTPIISSDMELTDIIDAVLENATIVYEEIRNEKIYLDNNNGEFHYGIAGNLITGSSNSNNDSSYGQCVVVKFTQNSNRINYHFQFRNGEYPDNAKFNFSLESKGFPLFYLNYDPDRDSEYTYVDYPYDVDMKKGQSYYALIAINYESEVQFLLWEENNTNNNTFYKIIISEEYSIGERYKNGVWGVELVFLQDEEPIDFEVATVHIVEFTDFVIK